MRHERSQDTSSTNSRSRTVAGRSIRAPSRPPGSCAASEANRHPSSNLLERHAIEELVVPTSARASSAFLSTVRNPFLQRGTSDRKRSFRIRIRLPSPSFRNGKEKEIEGYNPWDRRRSKRTGSDAFESSRLAILADPDPCAGATREKKEDACFLPFLPRTRACFVGGAVLPGPTASEGSPPEGRERSRESFVLLRTAQDSARGKEASDLSISSSSSLSFA